ncbi:putative bifunctional diguanylate cyclase/phosphodiesterase [Cellulomonas bogoriensis]|uniref:Diguanylate cyclase n=1 Tax=Cellulomonas bogoriensis 69B4 = DSM 16987 TaxID=1386082 RepID=A0A0A0BU64_9CELL|nr:bifunctional diguanylate cyclase/phosphodiesterase [Cellulomonas bogoriensis]KGM11212.1 hypothetical protein N869_03305 [Cellulomonas bogoriensis 69B4 = DSM 16987]
MLGVIRVGRAWLWFLGVGGAAAGAQVVMPYGLARDALFALIALAAAAALVVGARRVEPSRRAPWLMMAGGVTLWAAGDVTWAVLDHVLGVDPFPSVADVFYLAAYPLLALALYRLAAGTGDDRNATALIDALLVAVVAGLGMWMVFIEPSWVDGGGELLARLTGVAYPVGGAVLITQLVHLGVVALLRCAALRLLMASFVLVLAADLLFQTTERWAFVGENVLFLDLLWTSGYVLWGAAALHPSVADDLRFRDRDSAGTPGRIVVIAGVALALPVAAIVEGVSGSGRHTTAIGVTGLAVVMLIAARLMDLLRRLRAKSERLEGLADTDYVTGLENARRLTARMSELLDRLRPRSAALLLVSIERFSEINETLGARTGDEILRHAAQRLAVTVGDSGHVARMGGAAFAVLLPDVGSGAAAADHAVRIQEAFTEPCVVSTMTVTVDVALGLALAPSDASSAKTLLARADVALGAARDRSERTARYAARMETGLAPTSQLMGDLRAALKARNIVLHYQPQVELVTGRVIGVEALVRWQHPVHGLVPPGAFVPAAERTGMIRPLTAYVLDTALRQCAVWRSQGLQLTVAVNLSVRNLLDPAFVGDVAAALDRHAVPATALELEVTETMAMVDPKRSIEVLGALDRLGVTLSVDDYGTGYSSLAYLQRLPLRRLKIDRSFVAGVVHDPSSAAIIRSTVELARHLGLAVVAEGVEEDSTLLALAELSCFAAQGFGLGRPVPAAQIPGLIEQIHARVPGVLLEGWEGSAAVPAQRQGAEEPSRP